MSITKIERVEIIQGEDRTVANGRPITLKLEGEDSGDALDLTGATEIEVCFKTDTADVVKTLTGSDVVIVLPATLGKITVDLPSTDTLSLKVGFDQSFQAKVTKAGGKTFAAFRKLLDVRADICD